MAIALMRHAATHARTAAVGVLRRCVDAFSRSDVS